ncbi:MAG TPA: hypothetical protein VFP57_02425 [Sphingomicrobium sp.]|jgi:hypothetical protein|nr:hypothetical protein [Sphingomicrobium sp.]
MAQHGYLGDGYGAHGEIDPDRDEGRDRRFMFEERGEESFRNRYGEDRRPRSDADEWFGGREPRGFDYGRSPRRFSSDQDDHYRSWRDRQMAELDRDYGDYCREREQQFHQDFDSWRRNRQGSRGGQTGTIAGDQSELILGAGETDENKARGRR